MTRTRLYPVLLMCLISLHLISNFIWLRLNIAYPTWDSAGHLNLAMIFSDNLPYLSKFISVNDFLSISNYYPPFVHLVGAVFLLLTGRDYRNILPIGTFFFLLAIIYLYKVILFHTENNQKRAFWTSLIFSLFPLVWTESRQFHLDVPLTALMLAAYYHLNRSEQLKSSLHSALFFIFFTLSQFNKMVCSSLFVNSYTLGYKKVAETMVSQ